MKLSCCMIVRDDASTLRACLESIRPHVDELVVVDTGSTDDSPEIARAFADRWELFLGCNDAEGRIEDFAMARNHSFRLATGDWVCWFDGDDVVRNGHELRALCAEGTADNHTYLLPYEYSRDAGGNVVCLQFRERLMRPVHSQVWRSPVHEYCGQDNPQGTVATVATERVVVEHRSSSSTKAREPGRNLRILKNYVGRVGEADVRALYYLGVEYAAAPNATIEDMGNSLRYLKRYVQLADWDDEKCKALLAIGEYYRNLGDHDTAIEWTQKAMITKSWPEPWFALGRSFYAMAKRGERPEYNYRRAAYHFMKGLEHPTDVVLFANPQERHAVHTFLNVCFHALGDNERALWSCEEGLKGLPDHEMLLNNRREYTRMKLRGTILNAADELRKDGSLSDAQHVLLRATLKNELRLETEASRQSTQPVPPNVPTDTFRPDAGKLDVVVFLGPALERWTPETWAQNGMGGSETMAWQMARRLRVLGHRVRVYVDCQESQQGVYQGVEWVCWQRFRDVRCDVLIASRFPWAVDDEVTVNVDGSEVLVGGCGATLRLLWVHDVHCGDLLDLRRQQRFDRILCLSEWHKAFFRSVYAPGGVPQIPDDKVIVTRNGIDLARFDGQEQRRPHRAIYSSSPDRGLLAAVMAWPKVRAQVPDAELHVFYGFGNWEKSAQMAGDQAQLAQVAHLKQLCRTTAGVVMRERVNQKELAREFMRAGVWLYPTWFSETSCITAMEAQAAGCEIITSPIAALTETCDQGDSPMEWPCRMLTSKWNYPSPPSDEFLQELTTEIHSAFHGEPPRASRMALARRFDLDTLAAEWDKMLTDLHAEVARDVVPKFKGAAE